jgi:hypothetical protein
MKRVGVWVFAVVLVSAALSSASADAPPFYTKMLQRGITAFQKGEYARAIDLLRVGAFGMLDEIPQYETAQIYIVLATEKLHRLEDAQAAARKFAEAERIAPSYASLTVDAAVRRDFDQLMPKLLTQEQLAVLPALSPIALRSTKNGSEVIDLYTDVRTRRRLTIDETQSLFNALVQAGHINDASGMRPLLPPAVIASPAMAPALAKVPVQAASAPPMTSGAQNGNGDINGQLKDADRAVAEARFGAARQIYFRLAAHIPSSRALALEVARGLHRTSALSESSILYQRLYPLQRGEEQHMVAEAVNRYELGDVPTARLLLGRAMTGAPRTPELSFYLPRIESGR